MILRLFALLAILVSVPAHAQDFTPAEAAAADRLVAAALARSGIPSASIAVVRDGRIAFVRAYGRQSPTLPRASTAARYPIASVSKQFTAAALLMLEDQGKLSLDDSVSRHLPGISGGDRITIRQLLTHTSGLRDYWPQDYSFAAMRTPVTPQGIVDRWTRQPLDFEPGTRWQYSNTGYVVAGLIVETVAGEPLLAFLGRTIFRPLGMAPIDTDRATGPGDPAPYRRHALGPVRLERRAADGWLWAAGGLAMTATDLARWDIARLNRALLPADDWAAQETPARLADGAATNAGLGVFVGNREGRRTIEHGGEAVGFLSQNIVLPDDRAAVVVLVNGWFATAQEEIAAGLVRMVVKPAPVDANTAAQTTRARALYEQLRAGRLDRTRLTVNANGYFDATVIGDYQRSLSALGPVQGFELLRAPLTRGGFVQRVYTIRHAGQRLALVTYAEPGEAGRFEQFLVSPTQ